MLLLAFVTAAVLASAASAGDGWKRCGRIEFTRASEDMASKIRAHGTSCRRARKVVRRAHNRATRRPYGYHCKRRTLDTPLPMWKWRCAKAGRRVKWIKS